MNDLELEKIRKQWNKDIQTLAITKKSLEEIYEDISRMIKGQVKPIGGYSLKRRFPLRNRRKKFKKERK